MHFLTRTRVVIVLVIVGLMLIVAIQNSYPISLFFLFWRAQVEGLLLFLTIFLVGALAGALAFWGFKRGGRKSSD
jgi:uncharacterized integral membrane protein